MIAGKRLAVALLSLMAVTLLGGSVEAQKANLIMVSWTAPTSAQGFNSTVVVNFKVTNYGSAAAAPFGVRFYYGDSSSTSGLTTLSTYNHPGLAAATTASTKTISLVLPGNVLYGARYLHYHIDHANKVSESNENDNRDYRSLAITGYPDLKVATIAVSPKTQSPGKNLAVSFRVYNGGYSRIPTYFYLRLYYSLTSAINITDTYLNRQFTISSLVAGGYYPPTSNGATTVTVPAGATSGTRYIGAIADYNHRVTEVTIANNTNAAAFTVTGAAGKADLQLLTWSAPVKAAGYKSKVPISFRIRNAGTGAAGAFQVRFYYGLNTSTAWKSYLVAHNHAALAAGASGPTKTVTGSLPNTVATGYRYLHYQIDTTSQVAETNENNNSGYRSLFISGKPDLRVYYLSVSPTSQSPSGALTVKYRLRNYGAAMVPNVFYTRFYFSNDSAIATTDTYLNKQFSTVNVKAGDYFPASTNGVITVTVPGFASAGTRYIGAYADYSKWVIEAIETNNTRAAGFTVKGSTLLANGSACSSNSQCKSKYCVDGVCCNSGCGLGNKNDCQTCSIKGGGPKNGGCSHVLAGNVCRAAVGPCDKAEACTGKTLGCPADSFKSASTTCRKAAGPCDKAEACSGKAAACPGNSLKPAKTACRNAAGPCDKAEACSGKSAACPADLFKPAKTACRAVKDKECDLLEVCSGAGTACPKDAHKPNNSPCSKGACVNGICGGKKVDSGADAAMDAATGDASAGDTTPGADGVKGQEASTSDGPGAAGDLIPPPEERGCTCRAGGETSGGLTLMLLLTALCGLGWRRRRG